MTTPPQGRTAPFLAPPPGEDDDLRISSPRQGEEAMRRLRNPFEAADGTSGDTGRTAAQR